VTSAVDELVVELAHETARVIAELAAEKELAWVNERDHLQPTCARVARGSSTVARNGLAVSTSLRFTSSVWPRLGGIDLAFTSNEGPPVVVELKCGAGNDALAACAWDALKLAYLLQLGNVSAAYLLAATPVADWTFPRRGTEFFTTRAFETMSLLEPYLDWWRAWERDGYPAGTRVPAGFRTSALCRVPFRMAASDWELAVAAVHAEGDEWVEWASVLSPEAQ
jgi:hypothetical protein